MKKRLAALMLAVTMVFTAVGCGGSAQKDYSFGTVTEQGFESSFLGYVFETPEGVTLSTREEIAKISGVTADVMKDDLNKFQLEAMQNKTVYDMMATCDNSLANVNVVITFGNTKGAKMDDVVAANIQQLESMTAMDVTVDRNTTEVTVAGKKYTKLSATNVIQGMELKQDMYIYIGDGYMSSITVTYDADSVADGEALLAAFKEKK